MLSEERKFLKTVDLYSKVVDAGLTWGFTDYEEVAEHKRLTGLFATQISRQNDKYEQRHTADLKAQSKEFGYVQPSNGVPIFDNVIVDLDNAYKYVRTGTPIREPNRRRSYW
jgi:hypothetical protein